MSDLPKYVKIKNGKNLSYQRRVPQQLLRDTQCKPLYQVSLGLDIGASPAAIHKAVGRAHESYDLHCKMMANSSPEAFNETELDRAATDLLNKLKMKPQQYAVKWSMQQEKGLEERPFPDAVGEVSAALFKGNIDKLEEMASQADYWGGLTFDEKVIDRAADKLLKASAYQPKTISVIYDNYVSHKGLKNMKLTAQERRNNYRVTNRIEKLIGEIGDHTISDITPRLISVALEETASERLKVAKVSTVARELNDLYGFINWANKKYKYNWYINKPDIGLKEYEPDEKRPLMKQEQQRLIEYCLSPNLPKEEKVVACISMLELQGGMMQSEIKTLEEKNIQLEEKYPYIMVTKGKTKYRRRLIPIILGLDFIKETLKETQDWLKSVTESAVSKRMADFIRKVIQTNDLSAHCLRHTLRHNADINNVPLGEVASIGGWSGGSIGVSEHMLKYGAKGIDYEERVEKIAHSSLKVHKHLLSVIGDNVIQLHG